MYPTPAPWHGAAIAMYEAGDSCAAIGRVVGRTRERVRQVVTAAGAAPPAAAARRAAIVDAGCRVADCGRPVHILRARLCAPHYAAERKYGTPSLYRPPQAAVHGTRSRYVRGCHCDACRAANAQHSREVRHADRQAAVTTSADSPAAR